ncbi:MAG: aldo/keto reductase [Deltaproteobacteria bacterium]|nr:MAG: aldo/keto reductase [Deltaproteobacteria bacterium]
MYSAAIQLNTWDIEHELLPLCASEGVGICVYSPLAGGLLRGKHDSDRSLRFFYGR